MSRINIFKNLRLSYRSLLSIIVLSSFSVTLLAASPAAADGERDSIHVEGVINETIYFDNCTSPVGVCGNGTVTGKVLGGTIYGSLNSIDTISKHGQPYAEILRGVATFTTPHGVVNFRIDLIQVISTNAVSGTFTVTGGTKRFRHTSGVLRISGTASDTGLNEVYNYNGWLSKDAGNEHDN